ncbi:MAG: SRPBCC domain-containing protein [Herpetosiphonaceae bacterium]|nr:SRPBCC domain-containing protein [Herpetosiphonaceae bacterium]
MTQTKRSDQDEATMENYTQTLHIHTSPHRLYQAVTTAPGLKGWWSDNTVADNDEMTVRFGGGNFQTMRLVDPTPDQHVAWEWIAQNFPVPGTAQTDEWVGTRVVFEIQANPDDSSTLVFTHMGLTPQLACYDLCNPGWHSSLESLKQYLEQGAGTPYVGPV